MTSNKTSPWALGLIEALKCVGMIRASNLQTKNRLAMLMLDSTLEIAIRQYLTNVKKITLDDKQHRHRDTLIRIAKGHIDLEAEVWDHLKYFWMTRNPQYHQEANVVVTDVVFGEFQDIVSHILKILYGIDSHAHLSTLPSELFAADSTSNSVDFTKLKSKTEIVIAAVSSGDIKGPAELNQVLKKLGIKKKLKDVEARVYLNNNYFYKDDQGFRRLSGAGLTKLSSIVARLKPKGNSDE